MVAEEEVEPEVITEPEMVAEEEVEPEVITEPENNEDPKSIMDLINANRENREENIDLFTEPNIHQIEATQSLNDEDVDQEEETDQDLLEIPSFLRRQNK